jgi:hypothetical protein
MDFVSGLPGEKEGNDAIWAIVDQLITSAYFLPMKMINSVYKLAKMYVNEVVRLHGVLVSIVLDRDPRFASHLWISIQPALGTSMNLSVTFHPRTNGQSEKNDSDFEIFVKIMYIGVWKKLERPPTSCKVYLQ